MRIGISASVLRSNRGALRRFVDRVRHMDDQQVMVGIPRGKQHTSPDGQSVDMSLIANVMNFGSPSRGILARPFVEPAINQNMGKYQKLMAREAKGILLGRDKLNQALAKAGMAMVADIQDYMVSHTGFAPLAASTIKAKGSSKPLIDTDQLRQAITYKVE